MTTTQGHKDVEGYMQAVTTPEQGQAGLPLEELIWLLGHAAETNAVRLRVLQSLQRGLPAQQTKADIAASGPNDLKEALTNVIIMQSRLNEREATLLDGIKAARDQALLDSVPVDLENLRSAASGIVTAYHRLCQIASGPKA